MFDFVSLLRVSSRELKKYTVNQQILNNKKVIRSQIDCYLTEVRGAFYMILTQMKLDLTMTEAQQLVGTKPINFERTAENYLNPSLNVLDETSCAAGEIRS